MNESMNKQDDNRKSKGSGKTEKSHLEGRRGKVVSDYQETGSATDSIMQEAALKYDPITEERPGLPSQSFKVSRAGQEKEYAVHTGYGYFIPTFQKAENMLQVAKVVEKGLLSEEIMPISKYLGFKVSDLAKAASVSVSTVSRWKPKTSIGVPGSNQFFRIDQVIRKGVDLFGGLDNLKGWLQSPNLALGNAVPAKLLTSVIGVELVDEALDALHFGNVM